MSIRDKYLWDTVTYNDHGCKLDVWAAGTPINAPAFMFIPGGAWMVGDRRFQGYALMSHLVERGWVCASVGYRTGFRRWPDQLNDVRQAWHWCDQNLMDYGAGSFMAVGGASAGAHMASLLGLSRSRGGPEAVVGLYGVYDWKSTRWDHQLLNAFVRNVVVGQSRRSSVYRNSSPIRLVHEGAPPFMLVHGTADILTPVSGARAFERMLASRGNKTRYHEVPGAGHAFDLFSGPKTNLAVEEIYDFLTDAWVDVSWAEAQ